MVAINTIKMSESDPEDERRRAILRQQAYADLLAQNVQRAGGDKVYGHGLGIAKIGGAALAGLWGRQADEQERSEEAAADELIASKVGKAFGGGTDAVSSGDPSIAAIDETGDGGRARGMAYARATKGIESGGNYGALGPVTKSGDRAYGAYQVMGANIPGWSKEALGRSVTPQEFLSSRDVQDKIYQAKFGQYAQKYGPEGAARAWFAGEGGMNNPKARDQLGTSVAQYGQRFMRGMGQDAPANPTSTQTSGAGGSALGSAVGGAGGGSGISAQDVQELVRNPRTRSYGLALYNAHVQEIATRQAQAAELAKESRGEARDLRKLEAERQPLPEATIQQQIAKARESRPQTNVTVGAGETEELKTRGKDLAGRLGKIAEDGDKAGVDLITLQRLQQLSQAVEPGAKTALMEEIRQRTGIQLDPNADNVQAFQAAVAKLIPNMRPEGSGGNSDKDMALFGQAAPSLMGTPGGNEIVMQTLGGLAQHRAARGDIAKSYQYGDLSAKQANEEMAKLGDPFAAFKEYQAKTADQSRSPSVAGPNGPVRVRTPEEARQLPPGVDFVLPDGRIGTVPKPMAPAAPMGPARPGLGPIQGAPSASRAPMPYFAYPTAGTRG